MHAHTEHHAHAGHAPAQPTVYDRLVPDMREPAGRYVAILQELAKDRPLAVTMYGAVVDGPFDPKSQAAGNVLVLDSIDLELLRRISDRGRELGSLGMAAPLVMTPPYIAASLDTFPIELLDIHLHHATIHGIDHFEKLTFEPGDIRLQCERELKSVLIGMRQGLLAAAGRDYVVSMMAPEVAERIVRTMRAMLHLKGRAHPKPGPQTIAELEGIIDRALPGLTAALNPKSEHGWTQFVALYRDIEALGEVANDW